MFWYATTVIVHDDDETTVTLMRMIKLIDNDCGGIISRRRSRCTIDLCSAAVMGHFRPRPPLRLLQNQERRFLLKT